MALLDYVTLGGVEIVNHVRLNAYLDAESVGSPLTSATACVCPTLTSANLSEDTAYTKPAEDPAPWYDAAVPESTEFAGVLLLSIEGLDENPVKRSVTNAISGGGVLGPARVLPRTLVFTAVLLGSTCCGVEYGLHWLTEALQGCAGNECDGDCMEILSCCPDEELDHLCLMDGYRRTLRRVALVDGPRVLERVGEGCTVGECSTGADILTVEWTLVAATPWLWTDPVTMIETKPPIDASTECITWCIHGQNGKANCVDLVASCPNGSIGVTPVDSCTGLAWPVDETVDECDSTCRLKPCTDATASCADPMCMTPTPPTVAELSTCYCLPLAVERQCCDMDLSECPAWSTDGVIINVRAGKTDLRNLTITIYERTDDQAALTCEQVANASRCDALASYTIRYIPAGGAVVIDGQTNRATVECAGVCETSPDVYGADGGPLTFPSLNCASYVICMESDVQYPPADDALVLLSVTGRGL
ncbi:hypothetical protein [Streptomyces sp. NBC_00425]|uniref:hypothetical protein n=1 Tax=Streptomyces sp. NBC_00425 TaxID=2975740 RepID=UPI002E1E2033